MGFLAPIFITVDDDICARMCCDSLLTECVCFCVAEVTKAQSQGKVVKDAKYVDIYREKPIRVSVKVLVPSKEHPKVSTLRLTA